MDLMINAFLCRRRLMSFHIPFRLMSFHTVLYHPPHHHTVQCRSHVTPCHSPCRSYVVPCCPIVSYLPHVTIPFNVVSMSHHVIPHVVLYHPYIVPIIPHYLIPSPRYHVIQCCSHEQCHAILCHCMLPLLFHMAFPTIPHITMSTNVVPTSRYVIPHVTSCYSYAAPCHSLSSHIFIFLLF